MIHKLQFGLAQNAPRITSHRDYNPMRQLQAGWSKTYNHNSSPIHPTMLTDTAVTAIYQGCMTPRGREFSFLPLLTKSIRFVLFVVVSFKLNLQLLTA